MRFSPDGKRLAILKNDPKTGNSDIWTFDVATGKATQVTFSQPREGANSPVWSPDGKYLAYVSFRQPYNAIFRKAADGTGDEELLFRYTPGAGVPLTDWSRDGKFLTFFTGALLVVPLRAEEKALDRKAIEWLREDYDAFAGAFSPDERYLAYLSNEVELTTMQLYVRPFDSAKPEAPAGPAVQVTNNKSGAGGMFWRQDGKELIYVTRDREVMALDVTTTPTFRAGAPKLLFKLTDPLIGGGAVSPDGERFIVAMPAR